MRSKAISENADESEPRYLEGFSPEGPCVKASTAMRIWSSKAVRAAAGIGVLALTGFVFYRVRELLAALLLFSLLFGVAIIAVLILWLIEEMAHEAAIRLETHIAYGPALHIVAASRRHGGHILRTHP